MNNTSAGLWAREAGELGLSAALKQIIIWFPLLAVALFSVALGSASLRPAALWMLREDGPVETLTFVVLLVGTLPGVRLALQLRPALYGHIPRAFFILFSIALLFIAMEEIAWGQRWLGITTPAWLQSANVQQELTLHNIAGLHGRSEWFRLIFGLGGMLGIWVRYRSGWRIIGAHMLLMSWFVVVALIAAIDVYNDFFPIGDAFDTGLQRLSELIELLIGIACLLYVSFAARVV